jgi:hypothetical protein
MGVGSWLLSTASGLIFHGESDGRIVAYDIKNGSERVVFSDRRGCGRPGDHLRNRRVGSLRYEAGSRREWRFIAGDMVARGAEAWPDE